MIFARVSSTGDRQDYQRQVNDLTDYATRNGMKVKRVFAEKVSGGKRNEEREELMNMIAYVKEHKVKKILASELSRVGRNTLQVLKTIEILNENGISLFIQNYGIETLTDEGKINPMSQLLVTILAEIARMERKTIQERMEIEYKKFRVQNKHRGKNHGTHQRKYIKRRNKGTSERGKDRPYGISARHGGIKIGYHKTGG